ncbi:phage conserved hypothetical protein BR0599 [Pseudoxanthobacter soli DSM 19599]|uniref:Bacteriophage phiJL001 Gp84 C-terminal domain-containing protein n=1 Tax=Pseudoxanthobacter soli DSM 19599 TaxID=1123029 RepID=A0A1M7ZMU9_9HYPH|nr:DUF2163 domain-containing protein [Pseudoxanthobacter soli]SHO66234.1 phage conserved hypothetical protein BR0599 [Pseudoxanthobacter soli DSM 19599]
MKTFDAAFAAHIAGETTTLCRCWKLIRTDGAVRGFTDHDEAVTFDGVAFEAAGGLEASAETAGSGLSAGGMDVAGALSSESLDEADLAAGRYDGARVELWLVNWAAPSMRARLRVGTVGDVTREDGRFRAEVRGLAQALDEPHGRIVGRTCDAVLGDGRCRADLSGLRVTGTVTAIDAAGRLVVGGIGDREAGWFTHGTASFLDGDGAGERCEIRRHGRDGDGALIELWQMPRATVAAGDRVELTAGCDKRFETCVAKFANHLNFRGFPHVPGNDFALYPASGDAAGGGTLV